MNIPSVICIYIFVGTLIINNEGYTAMKKIQTMIYCCGILVSLASFSSSSAMDLDFIIEKPRVSRELFSEKCMTNFTYTQIIILEATQVEKRFKEQTRAIELMGGAEALLRRGKDIVAEKDGLDPNDDSDEQTIIESAKAITDGIEYIERNGFGGLFSEEREILRKIGKACELDKNVPNRKDIISSKLAEAREFGRLMQYRMPMGAADDFVANFFSYIAGMLKVSGAFSTAEIGEWDPSMEQITESAEDSE